MAHLHTVVYQQMLYPSFENINTGTHEVTFLQENVCLNNDENTYGDTI